MTLRTLGTCVAVTLAVVVGLGAGGAFAGLIPDSDAAFDNAFLTAMTLDASSNSNNPYGYWWSEPGPGTATPMYTQQATGGNPDAWAQRIELAYASRPKVLVYAINDSTATTGTQTLSFDVKLDSWENTAKTPRITAEVYGIPDSLAWGTGSFALGDTSGNVSPLALGIPSNAVSLASVDLTNTVTVGGGWESYTLSVPLGTGYDVIVVSLGIRGVYTDDNGGFDNAQITPEPATLALMGLGGLGLIFRRKRRK